MEGDKVTLMTVAEEVSGDTIYTTKLGEKPQFMLDEEYREQIIKCAAESLKIAVKAVYPNMMEQQKLLASAIALGINFKEK